MSNTMAAGLILDTLGKRVNTLLGNVFAPLGGFASDFTEDPLTQGQRVQIPQATAGGTTQTNATNWESGDSTLGNIGVTVSQYSQSWHITPLQLNNNFRLAQLVDINLQYFANKIMDVAMTPINGVSFVNFIEPSATFTATNLRALFAAGAKLPVKNILLDGTYYANFLPTLLTEIGPRKTLVGFDNFFLNTRWSGAGVNVLGFMGGPQSLAYVSGLPIMDDETRTDINATPMAVKISDSTTMTVLASTWLSRATRLRWASLDVMFGASVLDNTGCRVIKSGGGA